jgi:hypothetical protein
VLHGGQLPFRTMLSGIDLTPDGRICRRRNKKVSGGCKQVDKCSFPLDGGNRRKSEGEIPARIGGTPIPQTPFPRSQAEGATVEKKRFIRHTFRNE